MAQRTDKELIEDLKFSLSLVNYWIDKADFKVSVSMGLFPLITALLQYLFSTVSDKAVDPFIQFCIHMVLYVCIILVFASTILFLFALKPNLKTGGKPREKKKHLLYYVDIQKETLDSFKGTMRQSVEDDFANELMNEIHQNSKICYNKMHKYKTGILLSIFSLFGQLFCFLFYSF